MRGDSIGFNVFLGQRIPESDKRILLQMPNVFSDNTRFPIQCRPFPLKELTNHGGRRIVEKKLGVWYLVLGLASGLEAFSREPPCDSIGALAVRQTPETSGMAREFLSYYPLLPSRYLRDPFTISVRRLILGILSQRFLFDYATKYTQPLGAQERLPFRFARISLAISG